MNVERFTAENSALLLIDHQVGTIGTFDFHVSIDEWDCLLNFDPKMGIDEITRETREICPLEQPGSQRPVNVDGGRQNA